MTILSTYTVANNILGTNKLLLTRSRNSLHFDGMYNIVEDVNINQIIMLKLTCLKNPQKKKM